jgi:hypothetical protein
MTIGIDAAVRNSRLQVLLDAIDNGGDEYGGGHLRIYSGDRPATGGEVDEYENELLLEFNLPYPSGTVSDGVLTFNDLGTVKGLAEDIASWARVTDAEDNFVMDLSVSLAGGGGEVILTYLQIYVDIDIEYVSATITEGNP